ncbi:MAG: hypothetical protein C5B53_09835 [Candidatus Melainabacteria bacterium]|nr:MAG: hypothetical protein C5B53_09835 [Candidatus Melainabacteria bacterium]
MTHLGFARVPNMLALKSPFLPEDGTLLKNFVGHFIQFARQYRTVGRMVTERSPVSGTAFDTILQTIYLAN